MRAFSSERFARRAVALSKAMAVLVCLIGALVLIGWVMDIHTLKSVGPGLIEMKANTALGLLLAGFALLAAAPAVNASALTTVRRHRVMQVLAAIVGLIGVLTLGEHVTGWNLGIDQLLFHDDANVAAPYFPGRMAPLSAVNFVLIGAALFLLDRGRAPRPGFVASEYASAAVAVTSVLVVLGYLFGVESLVRIQDYTSMAIHTAIAFLLLSVSTLCARPHRGPMASVGSEDAGGSLLRRLVPAAVLVPIVLAWLGLMGEEAGLYSAKYGFAIRTIASVAVLSALIWITARALGRTDAARRRSEHALREAEEKYRSIFEHASEGIYQTTEDGIFIAANPAMARLLGCASPEELLARVTPGESYASSDGRAAFLRLLSRDGVVHGLEYEVLGQDGKRRWVSENARIVRNAEGAIQYFEGTLQDITERRQKEHALSLFRALIDHSSDGIEVLDPDTGRFIDINERTCRDLGYTREELLTMSVTDIDPVVQRADREKLIRRLEESGHALFESVHRRKDGSTFPVEINISRLTLDRPYLIVVVRDITARRAAEASLRLQGEALNAAANAIVVTDCNGRIEWVNRALTTTTGYDEAEVIGRNPGDLFKSGVHDQAFYKNLWDTLLAGQVWSGEMVNRRKDGSLYTEAVTITPINDAKGVCTHFIAIKLDISDRKRDEEQLREQAELLDHAQDAIVVRDLEHRITYWNKSAERLYGWTAADAVGRSVPDVFYRDPAVFYETHDRLFLTGEWTGELQQVSVDGRELWVESRWKLIRDRSGAPKSVLVINTDITERKQLEQQFLRAQRLESIGTLAGGIAHDLNNVLAPIMMSVDLLTMKVADADSRSLVETIGASAQRGSDMVRQVLSFARGLDGRRVDVQLRHLIREMEKIARDTFPKNIRVSTAVSRDLWTVLGDPTQLHQVLLNLCINARDAMPGGGALTVSARNATFDAGEAAAIVGGEAGPCVVIEVKDTGTGIPQTIINKIFDPFFTTKEVGKGTGLGLSTSLTIVKQHGGLFRVTSEPGVGTEFHVCLPAQVDGGDATSDADAADLPRGDGETVLVVDDEAAIREITRQTLEAFGYRVLLASDGSEAVSLYAQHADDIAVVVIDLMMPGMDGATAIQVLVKMNAAVRIIAISGRAAAGHTLTDAGTTAIRFLPKPFSAEALLQELRTMLANAGGENLNLFQ